MPETRTSPQNGPGTRVNLGEASQPFVRLMTGILQLSLLDSRPRRHWNLCHMTHLHVTVVTCPAGGLLLPIGISPPRCSAAPRLTSTHSASKIPPNLPPENKGG